MGLAQINLLCMRRGHQIAGSGFLFGLIPGKASSTVTSQSEALRSVLCLAGCPEGLVPEGVLRMGVICMDVIASKVQILGLWGIWKRSEGAFPETSFPCWGTELCLVQHQRHCPRELEEAGEAANTLKPRTWSWLCCVGRLGLQQRGNVVLPSEEIRASSEFNSKWRCTDKGHTLYVVKNNIQKQMRTG